MASDQTVTSTFTTTIGGIATTITTINTITPTSTGAATGTSASVSATDTTSVTSTTGTPTSTTTPSTNTSNTSSTSSTPASSSGSSSASSTSPSSSSSATPISTTSLTTSTSIQTSRSTLPGGGVVTLTSTSTKISTSSGIVVSQTATTGTNKTFFQNKGAVAGVFTAVGLIALIILVILITTGIRRRRAKQFDREIEEAAAAAATTQAPAFLDDEDDDPRYGAGYGGVGAAGYTGGGGGGGYAAGAPYSDVSSSGTYAQPPMTHESYGMREMGHGPAPGEIFDPYALAGVGAGVGAGAMAGVGVARARSSGAGGLRHDDHADGETAPYPAFAAAPNSLSMQHDPGRRELDLLEAAGMGGMAGTAAGSLSRGPSTGAGAALARGPSFGPGQYYNNNAEPPHSHGGPERNKSLGSTAEGGYASSVSAYSQQPLNADYAQGAYGDEYANLARQRSLGGAAGAGMVGGNASPPNSGGTEYYSPSGSSPQAHAIAPESYAAHYQPGYQPPHMQGFAGAAGVAADNTRHEDDDAYGGYTVDHHPASQSQDLSSHQSHAARRQSAGGMPNPFGRGEEYSSEEEDEEEEPRRRVLRVANE